MAQDREVFSFADSKTDNPYDILEECVEGLEALEVLFGVLGKEPLGPRAASGVNAILRGIRASVDSASQELSDREFGPSGKTRAHDAAR